MGHGGYRELDVWRRAKNLAVNVYRLTHRRAFETDWGLRDQLRRSAVSVPSNIAEGCERGSDKDGARFFHVAKGSLGELDTQLEIAADVGHCEPTDVRSLQSECGELARMIAGLIKSRTT
jgi:four helix bundle protein